ncbi:MAG: FKBP-type peptidyl-prolyl cis-trans isomerase [Candidatus Woesearchaeota archaeon]
MSLKKGDFIKLDYTGKVLEENIIFDSTKEDIGKKENLNKKNYEPVTIIIGEGQVIKGLDESLVDKEIGKEYSINIIPEKAFGKKNTKLIQLISLSKFKRENIKPIPGLQVQIDNQTGIVKAVTGGRVMVDFNHPLSGKEVNYTFKILEKIENDKEKIKGYFSTTFGIKELNVNQTEKGFEIETINPLPDIIKNEFEKKLKQIISDKYEFNFSSKNDKKDAKE